MGNSKLITVKNCKKIVTFTCETMAAQPREDGSRFLKKPRGLCDGRHI